ncbi:hypothetical protein APHAL10511_005117 [Amanita phalloides]|nr:hypothetical protein APHAL10511_005117 [Amanita phalloides]
MDRHRGSTSDALRRRQGPSRRPSNGVSYAGTVGSTQPRQPTAARTQGEARPAPLASPIVRLGAEARPSGSSAPAMENRVQSSQSGTPDRQPPTTPINNSQGRDDGEGRDTRATDKQEAENEVQDDTRPRRDGANHRQNSDGLDRHRRDDDGRSAAEIIDDLKYYARKRTRYIQKLKEREAEQEKVIEKMKSQLARAQTDRDQVDELMKDRTAELHSAQTFLGKADGISIAEVSKSVEFLNAEIHQAAAIIMDSISCTKLNKTDKKDEVRLNTALNALVSFAGPPIKRMLYNKMTDEKEDFDPTISQIVLQSGLVSACAQIIKQWDSNPLLWDTFSSLDAVYNAMRTAEGQAIAGRWRALAHAYISSQNEDSIQLKETTDYLKKILGYLLAGVGWSERVSNVPIPPEYEEKIDIIARKAIEVHNILRKDVTSMDLEAYIVPFGHDFDSASMEDEYGDGEKDSSSLGVCTVALGLRSKKVLVPKNHGAFKEEIDDILKPKVVLVSALVGTEYEDDM